MMDGWLLFCTQMIWDEVGENKFEREKVLLDIEQECVEAYRRKVDHANISRSRLHQELAESEAELTHLLLCLGERSVPGRVRISHFFNIHHANKEVVQNMQ